MASRQDMSGARPKVKVEAVDDAYAGASGSVTGLDRASEHVAHLRAMARRLAAEAGFVSPEAAERASGKAPALTDTEPEVNKDGGLRCDQMQVKTPKFSGKADWEAFHAQFELLAKAAGWSENNKALQLALCLTDEALSCLLLLCPAERDDYGALVGALRRRFGQCNQPGVLRSELSNRRRRTGEPLRVLANDIETLVRRAYARMPTEVQSELARDQFIQAITPRELRIQTQLAHPHTLQEALELALEREAVGGDAQNDHIGDGPVVRTAVQEGPGQDKPAWADELTELVRAVSLQSQRSSSRPRRGPPVCWACGQPGHIRVQCPKHAAHQGNAPGSA